MFNDCAGADYVALPAYWIEIKINQPIDRDRLRGEEPETDPGLVKMAVCRHMAKFASASLSPNNLLGYYESLNGQPVSGTLD